MKFEMPSCGGCRSCELACSFHWRGEFVPAPSSLKIVEKDDGDDFRRYYGVRPEPFGV